MKQVNAKKEIKERFEGFNLDLENLCEKFNAQAHSKRQMRESWNSLQYMADIVLTVANQTQQYPQKIHTMEQNTERKFSGHTVPHHKVDGERHKPIF